MNEELIAAVINSISNSKQIDYSNKYGVHIEVDKVSSQLAYLGFSERDASFNDPVWGVYRLLNSSLGFSVIMGNGLPNKMIWNNRTTYFTPVASTNVYSLLTDGINDYATLGAPLPYDVANQFSVSMYLKADNLAAQRCFVSMAEAGGGILGWFIYHLTGAGGFRLQMRTASTSSLHDFTDLALTENDWAHFVFTFSGNSNINGANVYLNAVKSVVTPVSTPLVGSMIVGQPFVVGGRNSSFLFSGKIDEVRIFNKALTQTEVTTLNGLGPAGDISATTFAANQTYRWKMGDGDVAPVISDHVGSNNLTIIGGANFVQDVP